MLRLRQEQMEIFAEHQLQRDAKSMVQTLRLEYPDATNEYNNSDLIALVLEGIQRAQSYDLSDQGDVERFVGLMLEFGHDFDTNPETSWAGNILKDTEIEGDDKMQALDDHILFEIKLGRGSEEQDQD